MEYLPVHDNDSYTEHVTFLRYDYTAYLIQGEVWGFYGDNYEDCCFFWYANNVARLLDTDV
jgi:hypothetical protein